jgi:hypothetical protein
MMLRGSERDLVKLLVFMVMLSFSFFAYNRMESNSQMLKEFNE